jgi:hypothetical protein
VSSSAFVKTQATTCPTGKRLLGGGARINPSVAGVGVAMSFPDNDNVYRVTAREFTATPSNWSVTVFAVCASAT